MKRKSGRKVSKKEEESSNGVDIDSKSEQNGDTSDHDEDEAPKDKKRKSSKGSRKSVSFSSKKEEATAESENSDDQEDDDPKEEKKRSKTSRKSSRKDDEESPESTEEAEENNQEKKKPKKGRKSASKEEKGAQDSEDQDEDDESQYEVEAVLDEKNIKGVRHYLIRWKGYEEESDTWEPEDTLDCDKLIEVFKENKKKGGKPKKTKKFKKELKTPDWDENEDFEVDKILEVHHRKDGKREFLVSWKGYSNTDNSWEPEDNMDCKDLIAKFMAKVEKARAVDERELRVNRPHVQRYTLSTQDTGRRLSRRFRGKERVQYHDAE